MYFLMVAEARNPRSKCQQGCFLLEALKENLLHASLLASDGWAFLELWLPLSSHGLLSCVFSSSYKDTYFI